MKPLLSYGFGVVTALAMVGVVAQAAPPRWAMAQVAMSPPTISGLNAAQQARFEQLRDDGAQIRRDVHAQVGALLERAESELSQPDADLRVMSEAADQVLWSAATQLREQREARLAFYTTLNAGQQAEVRSYLAQRLARAQRLHALIGDHLGEAP